MFLRYNILSIAWATFILIATLIPGKSIPEVDLAGIDKIVHFIIFGILVLLLTSGLKKQYSFRYLRYNPVISAISFAISFGILIELLQTLIPGRAFSGIDILANSLGALLAGLISFLRLK